MFIWMIGLSALTLISAIFGFSGIQTPSTDAAVFLFQVFSLALIIGGAWALVHRHENVIGHRLHRHS